MRIRNGWWIVAALCAPGLSGQTATIVENATVRVLSAVDKPHQKSALHKHDSNRVMIYLTAGDLDVTTEDGRTDHQHWKAGDVAWSPGGPMHVSENVGSGDLRIIEVEIRKPAPEGRPQRNRGFDPLLNDPSRNKLIFENPQVRVFRSTLESGDKERWHEHAGAGRVAVLMSPISVRIEPAKGQASPLVGGPGDAIWSEGAVKHRATNIGTRTAEIVVIEVN